MELVAGFAGDEQSEQTNINNTEEGDQQFDNQEQNFQQDQQFDQEQEFQQDQQFDDQEQNFQQDQQFDDQEQNFQQDQQFDQEQEFQQEQQFEQLQELNNQFGQITSNQSNAFGEPPLQQDQDIQPQSLDFENSFDLQMNNQQLSDRGQGNATIDDTVSNAMPTPESAGETAAQEENKPDPIATILEEFTGIPEPNEFSGAELPGTMKELAPGEAPETYIIRPGDTLYDICDQLLDEPTYWPKLWAMNSDIKNPHFIYPEFALQFYSGDNNTPPVIKVVNIEEFDPEGDIKPDAAIATDKLFKPKEDDFELLDPEDVVIPEKIEELFTEDIGKHTAKESATVELPALILPNKLGNIGKVVRGDPSMQENDSVLLTGGGLSLDTLYTIMRHQGMIWGAGHRYDFVANARIISNGKGKHSVATLVNLNTAPQKGDIVIDYRSRQRRVYTTASGSAEVMAKIVALTSAGQTLGAAGDFAFIKLGGEDISAQQMLPIYRSADRYYQKKSKALDATPIGSMQIIDVQDGIAVAYIISNDLEVLVGDKTSQ